MSFLDITISGTDGTGGLRLWEDDLPYLYLDSRKINGIPAPLVTVGIGCAVGPASVPVASAEVLGLAWIIDGEPASEAEIHAGYAAVCAASSGYVANYYQTFTELRLRDGASVALCQSRLAMFAAALRHTFPQFDVWPQTCQAGALDLIYGLGVSGFQAYHLFINACLKQDWAAAATQCGADTNIAAYDKRNAARKTLFLTGLEAGGGN